MTRLKFATTADLEAKDISPKRLCRQDVIEQHLDAAIELIFTQKSPSSAHVLAWAASDVLRGVAATCEIRTVHADFEDYIKTEHVKKWREKLRADYTYFKHTNKDANIVLETFKPLSTWMCLLAGVVTYLRIYKLMTFRMSFFYLWFVNRYPDLFKDSVILEVSRRERLFERDKSLIKAEELFREVLAKGEPWRYALPE